MSSDVQEYSTGAALVVSPSQVRVHVFEAASVHDEEMVGTGTGAGGAERREPIRVGDFKSETIPL